MFNYEVFRGDGKSALILDYETYENYSVFDIKKLAKLELDVVGEKGFTIFTSYIEYGYYGVDGKVSNYWNIRDLERPVEKVKNSRKVLVVIENLFESKLNKCKHCGERKLLTDVHDIDGSIKQYCDECIDKECHKCG